MASGLCAALTGRTHGCTDQPANVKKTLANSEPSTHGTKRTFQDVGPFVRFRAKADMVWSQRECVPIAARRRARRVPADVGHPAGPTHPPHSKPARCKKS
jgi:hypothetical protein